VVTMRLRATATTPRPKLPKAKSMTAVIAKQAKVKPREIYWMDMKKSVKTPIYDGAFLKPGNKIKGPAVIETTQTTVVIHPGRTLKVDAYGNFEILFGTK